MTYRKGSQDMSSAEKEHTQKKTPTFLLELPLQVTQGQAARLRAHLEAGRQFYNAVLSEGQKRLRQMRADPAWQAARAIPRPHKQERATAFRALRQQYGFSEYALHGYAKRARASWLAEHLDAVLAQTLATRAYQALNRVCLGAGKRVRFKSRGRGLSSIENKRNDTGLRFVLQKPEEGHQGFLIWHTDQMLALIDWNDPVVKHGLEQRIKYARLVQRKASSPQAKGADEEGCRYFVQLALAGVPYHKPKHPVGKDIIGTDVVPSAIALVPQQAEARLTVFCEALLPDEQAMRRLQRKMDRQRRAANADYYDEKGRIKKHGKKKLVWKNSRNYEKTRRRKATKERKLAAHRKSLHGCLVHEIVAVGNTIFMEKISYKAWQKHYGRSIGLRAPGMFVEMLRRTGASHGRHPAGSLHAHDQTQPVLSWLRQMRKKTLIPAMASVRLWHRSCPTGSLFRLSRGLSRSSRPHSLVCPVCRSLGRCGGAPAGSIRESATTCERGAEPAPKLWHPQSRSASAQQSE
jgi:hypothetical protein